MYISICICITFFALTLCYTSFFFFLLYIVFIHVIVHVYSKTSISINKYMQKAGESENDAGFLKHVAS